MSVSWSLNAYTAPDDPEYIKHARVLRMCNELGVSLPVETQKFFNVGPEPCLGTLTGHREVELEEGRHFIKLEDYMSEDEPEESGFEVDLRKLPTTVTTLKFTVSN